jgi:hypothetical protein
VCITPLREPHVPFQTPPGLRFRRAPWILSDLPRLSSRLAYHVPLPFRATKVGVLAIVRSTGEKKPLEQTPLASHPVVAGWNPIRGRSLI